jgi:hypothetical protein
MGTTSLRRVFFAFTLLVVAAGSLIAGEPAGRQFVADKPYLIFPHARGLQGVQKEYLTDTHTGVWFGDCVLAHPLKDSVEVAQELAYRRPFDRQRNPAWDGFRPPPVGSVESQDGRLLVNGRPFLPRLLYHAAHWHMGLREAGEKGFNMVQTYGISPETYRIDIDNAYENGMYSAVALNELCDGSEASLQRVERIAVNGLGEPVKARLTMPPEAAGSQAAVRYEHRTLSLQGRILEDSFETYTVHLYELPLAR